MKVSLNWIKDYIDLTGITAKDIIEKLTMSGLEVEDAVDEYFNFKPGHCEFLNNILSGNAC